ncbi:hypothetical protein C2G38_2167099 [Gigaspora rosea]|uniref:Uncharacterized protein n=1 Tax=Gigaspora rosea TaxID=44941 RepID=A0A397VR18_9GLOM|nr:hypothetical protein C2G38_2167099 [Gigaspora rosea]
MSQVIIVGSGLSVLSAAHTVLERGVEGVVVGVVTGCVEKRWKGVVSTLI